MMSSLRALKYAMRFEIRFRHGSDDGSKTTGFLVCVMGDG
jgi:hypothetical protein